MNLTEKDITGPIAQKLRNQLELTQKSFWNPLGVQQSVACRYEAGDARIPQAVRILLVAHYISGVKIDTTTQEGVDELTRLGAIQSKQTQAKAIVGTVRTDLAKAMKSLQVAADALQSI